MWKDLSKSFKIASALRIIDKDFSPPNGMCCTGLSLWVRRLQGAVNYWKQEPGAGREAVSSLFSGRQGWDLVWMHTHTHFIHEWLQDLHFFGFHPPVFLLFLSGISPPGWVALQKFRIENYKLSQTRIVTSTVQLYSGMASTFSFSFILSHTYKSFVKSNLTNNGSDSPLFWLTNQICHCLCFTLHLITNNPN